MLYIKLKGMEHRAPCFHIFCPCTHPRPKLRLKGHFFLQVVMFHIKLKGMEHRAPCFHMFCPCTHPRPRGWGKRSFFSESSHFAYQTNGNGAWSTTQEHILSLHILSAPWGWVKRSEHLFLLKVVMLHIELKGVGRRAPFHRVC